MKRGTMTLVLGLVVAHAAGCHDGTQEPLAPDRLVIFHTNDRHSSFLGHTHYDYAGDRAASGAEGGVARLARVLGDARAGAAEGGYEVLLFSAGDFSMGTMMRAAQNNAADLKFLDEMGYDAAALGNHEFDWGAATVPDMIAAAGGTSVPLLCANIAFSDGPEDDAVEDLYGEAIRPWVVVETPAGHRIGAVGWIGDAADRAVLAKDIAFVAGHDELAAIVQPIVDHLREVEQVDLVVALAHAGLHTDGHDVRGDTVELARRVMGIDIILSGHDHGEDDPVEILSEAGDGTWTTLAMETRAHGRSVGRYDVDLGDTGPAITAEVILLDADIEPDPAWVTREQELIDDVESGYLSRFPDDLLTGDFLQVLATSDFDVLRHANENNNLLYLVTDAMRATCDCDFAVASNGHDLRGSLYRSRDGSLALGDVFNVVGMGRGIDPVLGNPVVKVYLPAIQLMYGLAATTCGDGRTNNDYMMGLSGLRVTCRAGSVAGMEIYTSLDESDVGTQIYDGENWIDYDAFQLVPVCMSLDIAGMLSEEGLTPMDAEGKLMTDLTEGICRSASGGETKIWYALATYIVSFGGELPDLYNDDEQKNPAGPYDRRAPLLP